ncbi:MAG: zinc metallopeptidase [Ruminococcaceae bacterium]|nr:zinc metallopeptidase [Oscillospiraceae bacterium]
MPYFYYDPTYLIVLPAILLAFYAQFKVQSTYTKFSQVQNRRGMTGAEVARRILDRNGLQHVRVERVSGNLTDHYDPRADVVRLSDGVYNSATIAAVGVAAHEVGHAVQHSSGYTPIKLRNTVLPVAQIGSTLAFPLVLLGFIFSGFEVLIPVGIVLYAAVVAFQLVTLPVELNASRRALNTVYEIGFLDGEETKGAKKVLSAAALTYIAAATSAILQLLRLLLLAGRRGDRD